MSRMKIVGFILGPQKFPMLSETLSSDSVSRKLWSISLVCVPDRNWYLWSVKLCQKNIGFMTSKPIARKRSGECLIDERPASGRSTKDVKAFLTIFIVEEAFFQGGKIRDKR